MFATMMKRLLNIFCRTRKWDIIPSVGVYQREDRYIVAALTLARNQVITLCESVSVLPPDTEPKSLGEAIIASLDLPRDPGKYDPNLPDPFRPILDAAEVTSLRRFARGMLYCFVWQEEGNVVIAPHENDGKGGFVMRQSHEAVRIPRDASPEIVGEALLTGMERCT